MINFLLNYLSLVLHWNGFSPSGGLHMAISNIILFQNLLKILVIIISRKICHSYFTYMAFIQCVSLDVFQTIFLIKMLLHMSISKATLCKMTLKVLLLLNSVWLCMSILQCMYSNEYYVWNFHIPSNLYIVWGAYI